MVPEEDDKGWMYEDGASFGVIPVLPVVVAATVGGVGPEKPYMPRGVFVAESELSPPLGEKSPWPVGEWSHANTVCACYHLRCKNESSFVRTKCV